MSKAKAAHKASLGRVAAGQKRANGVIFKCVVHMLCSWAVTTALVEELLIIGQV